MGNSLKNSSKLFIKAAFYCSIFAQGWSQIPSPCISASVSNSLMMLR